MERTSQPSASSHPLRRALWGSACGLVLLGMCFAESPEPAAPKLKDGKITLTIPKSKARDVPVTLSVQVASIPRGARILVSSEDGKLLGAIAPYGPRSQGAYTLAIPEELRAVPKLSLVFRLEEKGDKKTRVPTEEEITSVTVNSGR